MSTFAMTTSNCFNGSRCESFSSCAHSAYAAFGHTLCVCLFVLLAALVLDLAVILLALLLSLIIMIKRICF